MTAGRGKRLSKRKARRIVLGRSALIVDDLGAGRLVRPFDLSLPAGFAYYVVYPPRAKQRPNVKAFRDWLIAEARSRKQ